MNRSSNPKRINYLFEWNTSYLLSVHFKIVNDLDLLSLKIKLFPLPYLYPPVDVIEMSEYPPKILFFAFRIITNAPLWSTYLWNIFLSNESLEPLNNNFNMLFFSKIFISSLFSFEFFIILESISYFFDCSTWYKAF